MKEVVIVSAVRSAVGKGKKDGALANVHAVDLSAHMMKSAIERAGIDPLIIDDAQLNAGLDIVEHSIRKELAPTLGVAA